MPDEPSPSRALQCRCGSGLEFYRIMGRGATYCESCAPRDGSAPKTRHAGSPLVAPCYGGAISTGQADCDNAVARYDRKEF